MWIGTWMSLRCLPLPFLLFYLSLAGGVPAFEVRWETFLSSNCWRRGCGSGPWDSSLAEAEPSFWTALADPTGLEQPLHFPFVCPVVSWASPMLKTLPGSLLSHTQRPRVAAGAWARTLGVWGTQMSSELRDRDSGPPSPFPIPGRPLLSLILLMCKREGLGQGFWVVPLAHCSSF